MKVVQHKTAIIIVTIKEERVCKAKSSFKEDYTTSYEREHSLFISLYFFSRRFKVTDVTTVIITSSIIGLLSIHCALYSTWKILSSDCWLYATSGFLLPYCITYTQYKTHNASSRVAPKLHISRGNSMSTQHLAFYVLLSVE